MNLSVINPTTIAYIVLIIVASVILFFCIGYCCARRYNNIQ